MKPGVGIVVGMKRLNAEGWRVYKESLVARDSSTGDKSHVSTRVMRTYGYVTSQYLPTDPTPKKKCKFRMTLKQKIRSTNKGNICHNHSLSPIRLHCHQTLKVHVRHKKNRSTKENHDSLSKSMCQKKSKRGPRKTAKQQLELESFEKELQEKHEKFQQLRIVKEQTEELLRVKEEALKQNEEQKEKLYMELKKLSKVKEFEHTMFAITKEDHKRRTFYFRLQGEHFNLLYFSLLGEDFNLACKILHLSEIKKDELMFFVWDGTDTPPVVIETKPEDETENPLPLQLEPLPLPRDILCSFPAVGTVLRVTISRTNEKIDLNIFKIGRWIKLVNLRCEFHAALWSAFIMPFTRICYLHDDDVLVLQRQRNYDERVSSRWGRMPLACFPWPSHFTETDRPDVPFVTLMNVLSHPEVTAKFRCVVRVVAMLPWRAECLRSPCGTYRIRLTLEDPTARLHAFLFADDAVMFFGGYHLVDEMTKIRNILLGVPENDDGRETDVVSRNPPWIQCCLKSYYIDKSDEWGSRNYRVFSTTFKGSISFQTFCK